MSTAIVTATWQRNGLVREINELLKSVPDGKMQWNAFISVNKPVAPTGARAPSQQKTVLLLKLMSIFYLANTAGSHSDALAECSRVS